MVYNEINCNCYQNTNSRVKFNRCYGMFLVFWEHCNISAASNIIGIKKQELYTIIIFDLNSIYGCVLETYFCAILSLVKNCLNHTASSFILCRQDQVKYINILYFFQTRQTLSEKTTEFRSELLKSQSSLQRNINDLEESQTQLKLQQR